MTSLDDALESASVQYDQPILAVDWVQLPPNEGTGLIESLSDLSDMMSGSYSVSHSFDDALPDPVTMTGSVDAAGKAEIELLGRDGHTFSTWSAPTTQTGENSYASNYIGTSLPVGTTPGTRLFMLVAVPSATALLTQGDLEDTPLAWDLVTTVVQGSVALWIYTKKFTYQAPAPSFYSSEIVSNTVFSCVAMKATDPEGRALDWRINTSGSTTSSATTTHNQVTLSTTCQRSVLFGFWVAPPSGTWTLGGSDTTLASYASATVRVLVGRAGLYSLRTTRTLSATSGSATGAAMFALAVEPFERPNMGPTEFWSPFNDDSPADGLDRDTAAVNLSVVPLTEDGPQAVKIFTGQMDDITVGDDQQVMLEASSGARITMNRSVNLPILFARREGGSIDFLTAWIAARGDRFIGPAPGPEARWWVPCYGSIHDGLGGPLGYNFGMYWTPTLSNVGIRYPTFVEGPFHKAVFACHTATLTQEIVLQGLDLHKNEEIWPWVMQNYLPTEYAKDLFSIANNAGRVSFWMRGDASYAGTPPNVPSSNRFLFIFTLDMLSPTGSVLGRCSTYMDTDRHLYIQMGNDTDGYTTLFWNSANLDLPTDGLWHFYSIAWSYDEGTFKVRRDGTTASTGGPGANGDNGFTGWYDTQDALYAAGGSIKTTFRSHMPFSDFIYEAGYESYDVDSDIWPTYAWPSFTLTTRATGQAIEAVPDDSPVNVWEALAEMAQNTRSWFRMDENDNLDFLPPSYWGETAQNTVDYLTDTEVNAQDLDIVADPSKSRNVVTVKFPETSVDLSYSTCLAMTTSTEIPPGITETTFTLDYPVAEIHGAATPFAAVWTITNLTASQITAGTGAAYDKHYMAVNTAADGSGTVLEERSVLGVIIDYTQTTVVVRFQNKTGRSAYLANNYQGDNPLPSLRIQGYLIKSSEAYVTERDGGSIGMRRERAMEVEMPWIHDRFTAQQFASQLVSLLARPRHEVGVVVMGDPRRTPGQLVALSDAGTTRASGNWRVMSITHNADGPEFTQQLRLVKVLPVAVWDQTSWDQSAWGV